MRVARSDARGGAGIEAAQQAMKVFWAAAGGTFAQAGAKFFRARGRIGQAFEKRAQIEAGARRHYRQALARVNVAKNFFGAAAVISGGEDFVRLD